MIHQLLTALPAAVLLAGYALGMSVGAPIGALLVLVVGRWPEP